MEKLNLNPKKPVSYATILNGGAKPVQPKQIFVPIPPRLQARLTAEQAAIVLGFSEHHIPVLISAGLLAPLGKPVPNATKYFASSLIEQLANDNNWLIDATQVIYDYWNGKKKKTHNSKTLLAAESNLQLA